MEENSITRLLKLVADEAGKEAKTADQHGGALPVSEEFKGVRLTQLWSFGGIDQVQPEPL
jgi:hypothetical protein